jgi:hypothetical protein
MNIWAWLAVHDAVCIVSGAYLVSHDCPWWWGALCFLLAATTTVRETAKELK